MPCPNCFVCRVVISLLLSSWLLTANAETPIPPAAPVSEPEIVLTVTINPAKNRYGRHWDINPFGIAPDVYGQILLGSYPVQTIRLRQDTHQLKLRFKNYVLNVGEHIYLALYDRDRIRYDDKIVKAKFTYEGQDIIERQLTHARVKLEFKGIFLAAY